MKKNNGIRPGLLLAVMLVILVFFLAIALVTSNLIASKTEAETYDHYQLLANDTGEKINSWLSSKKEIIENQRAALEITGMFSPEQLTEYLSRAVKERGDLNEICDLYFVDTDNVLSTGNGFYTPDGVDLRERLWYRSCIGTRGMYYSSPYLDISTGSYVMTISVAVYDSSDVFRGVLAIDIYTDAFLNTVNYTVVPTDSYVFLLDGNLGLAAHANPKYGYVDNAPVAISDLPDNIYADIESTIVLGKNERTLITDYDGVKRDMFISRIDCCSWYVVAAVSDNFIHSSERLMIVAIIVALFISLAVGIFWTFIGTKGIMRRLSAAMEAANAANETKSFFLANMSHEIRTPINAVICMNEMIMRENSDPAINDYTQDIAAASRSLIGIINDILDFSKIESGKLEMVETEFNITSMVNDIVSLAVSRLGEKPLELFVRVDPTIPTVIIGDEMRIKQIIVNLLTNGIKYTNEGYVSLTISYAKRDYGINLDVAVKDSGIGITPDNIEKLFTSFQQVDTKRNRSVEGTGLGLAITKRLVERFGGFVNVNSEYGVGSEFRVSLPLKVADNKPFVRLADPESIHAVCLFDLGGYDVDTVDRYMRDLIDMREKMMIDMRISTNIEEVRELAENGQVNTVFVDRPSFTGNEAFFERIAGKAAVFLVQNRINAVKPSDGIRVIYKPFYSLSAAAALNDDSEGRTADTAPQAGFIAPDAKILVVDDNIINLKVAVGLMKPYGMQVHTADSGRKAIEMLEQSRDYTMVFMDHMMPEMDGIEATGIIRGFEGRYFKELPVIALTANTVNDARDMFLRSGFDDFLAKPIDISMLDRVLRRFLPDDMRVRAVRSAQSEQTAQQTSEGARSRAVPAEKPKAAKTPGAPAMPEFDPSVGIRYTGGDEGLYLDILTEYTKNGNDMRESLIRACIDKNWKDFVIKVHALKSTSLNIGALPLSELAKRLELAGKAGEYDEVIRGSGELFDKYVKVLALTTDYLAEKGIVLQNEGEEAPDESELTEVSREQLDELIRRFLTACDDFDREEALRTADEAKSVRCGDMIPAETFIRASELIEDFEYDEAVRLVSGLREGADGNE